MNRIAGIDAMRALAIFIMLIANATPYLCESDYPYSFRVFCSIAAPIFTFLSGFTFAMNKSKSNRFSGAFYVLLSAIFVDIFAWGIPPFQIFDVLYVIAFGQFVLAILQKGPNWLVGASILLIVILSILLPFEYRFLLSDPTWNKLWPDIERFAFDGWFPVLPWLAFPLFGYGVYNIQDWIKKYKLVFLSISILGIISGLFLMNGDKNLQALRQDYVEIFYPANLGFLVFAFFFCILIFLVTIAIPTYQERFNQSKILIFGRHSMFVYIIHAILIGRILANLEISKGWSSFIMVIPILFLLVFLMTLLLEKMLVGKRLKSIPKWISKALGLY